MTVLISPPVAVGGNDLPRIEFDSIFKDMPSHWMLRYRTHYEAIRVALWSQLA